MSHTVDIPDDIKSALKKFRFSKAKGGALVVKIDKKKLIMVEEERYDTIKVEDLVEELPENAPRYVVLSYELKYDDGRTSYPLVLINWAPTSSETSLLTLHASALIDFQNVADIGKVIEVRDGAEGLTKEIIDAKLKQK